MCEVSVNKLESVLKHILEGTYGYSAAQAAVIADVLMFAQCRSNSQGVIKLVTKGIPKATDARITVDHETKLSARLNGHGIFGVLLVNEAVRVATRIARAHGLSIVSAHGTASGTGAIGYFARQIAQQDLIGVVLSQSPEYVAPYGSYQAIYGTNPFAFGIPTQDAEKPLVADLATSAIARFKVEEALYAGHSIPDDVAYDRDGHETTNPAAALMGALRVFDRSYKGSHIALLVEILAGALAGGDVENKEEAGNWGSLIVVLDPELLGPADVFKDKVVALLKRVRCAKPLPGFEAPSLPGDHSEAEAQTVRQSGKVRLEVNLYEGLVREYRCAGGALDL